MTHTAPAPSTPTSVLLQSAKLGDLARIAEEIVWAQSLLSEAVPIGRIYGVSGGALAALPLALAVSARLEPDRFGAAAGALGEFGAFVRSARSRGLRRLNVNPLNGAYNLNPLRRWVAGRLEAYTGRSDQRLSDLPVALYLCAADRDATFTLFGRPDDALQFEYGWVRVGPPRDAPIVDALIAALSTLLSTEPAIVNGEWYRDCRPAIVDARAIVSDLEAVDPRPILCRTPHTPLPNWRLNWITSSFIMHRQHERNQSLLARAYVDLVHRHRQLTRSLAPAAEHEPAPAPAVYHVDLPYIGSTEAATNMRQSVADKEHLMDRFRELLNGQLDGFPFDRDANVIYGAGGFSGILAGLVTTRQVQAGFAEGGGTIRQIYGVSAGVLNGFFHAVQVAASKDDGRYTPAARHALADLESFFSEVAPAKIARVNLNPRRFWQGWANLEPLEAFLLDRLGAYTGVVRPQELTFDDIGLPLTVAAARGDGFTEFVGMTRPERRMRLAGRLTRVIAAPVVKAILAGWSMNTYIQPTVLGEEAYRDGGGTFYDPALFVACLDAELTDLLNIHLDEPEGHSYRLPPRPHLVRLLLDTHNYSFPEERRRMRRLTDLLYEHYRLRRRAAVSSGTPIPPDFRQEWDLPES